MKIYSKKELLDAIGITYQTLLRWEEIQFVKPPAKRLGQVRMYTEKEYSVIIERVKDILNNPEKYSHVNVKVRRTNAYQKAKTN